MSKLTPEAQLRVAIKSSDTVLLRQTLAAHPEVLNLPDEKGRTPLHLAAELQDLSIVAALVDAGADIAAKIPGAGGMTARDIAYCYGEIRMGAYTKICLKIVARLEVPPFYT